MAFREFHLNLNLEKRTTEFNFVCKDILSSLQTFSSRDYTLHLTQRHSHFISIKIDILSQIASASRVRVFSMDNFTQKGFAFQIKNISLCIKFQKRETT